MRNGDEASPSIILAVRALLVKMLIIRETPGRNAQTSFRKLCVYNVKNDLTFTITSDFHEPYLRLEYRF